LACCHFLIEEFFEKHGGNKGIKFLFFVLGFGIVVAMNATLSEHHH